MSLVVAASEEGRGMTEAEQRQRERWQRLMRCLDYAAAYAADSAWSFRRMAAATADLQASIGNLKESFR